ncbi:MAG: tetratricopeptide repeat protein [Melioribacteraceae bacterium]|nr:tetratricopeptide repeat protein [Melioribacteraceae bacterium]
MKKILLLLFSLAVVLNAQSYYPKLADGINLLERNEFTKAYNFFSEIKKDVSANDDTKSAVFYFSALSLYNLKEYDGAISEFEEALELFPNSTFNEQILYRLGELYFINKEFRKSREKFLMFLNIFPLSNNFEEAHYWIGETFLQNKRYYEAEEYLLKAYDFKENNTKLVNAIYSLGIVYEKLNKNEDAIKYYDELLTYYQDDLLAPLAQYRIGIANYHLRFFENSVLELSDPLTNKLGFDDKTTTQYYLASSLIRTEEYAKAEDIFKDLSSNFNIPEEVKNKSELSLAWIYFQKENYENAYKIFDSLSVNADDSVAITAFFWKAETQKYMGDFDRSIELFKNFIEKYPNHKYTEMAQLNIGSVNYRKSNPEESEKFLAKALKSRDKSTKAKSSILLGEIRMNQGRYSDAKSFYESGMNDLNLIDPLYGRALLGLGVSEYYLNKYENSIQFLSELKNRFKDFEQDKVNFYLAESYSALGEFNNAIKHYNLVKDSEKELDKQVIYGKGYAYFNQKNFTSAIAQFNDFIKKYRNDIRVNDAKFRLADSYYGTKNYDRASAIYSDLFRESKNLNSDAAYYQYAQALYKSGKSTEAINEFKALQSKFPRSKFKDESQYVIGWISFQNGQYRNAVASYEQLIEKYPSSELVPVALYSSGDSYFNLGAYDSANVFYNRVLNDYPKSQYVLDAINGIQYSYLAIDKPEEAANEIDRFLKNNPNSSFGDQILLKKGDLYFNSDSFSKAISEYDNLISRYPSSNLVVNAFYWIAKSSQSLKRESDAIEAFKKVVNNYSKSDIAVSAVIDLSTIYDNKKNYSEAINYLDKIINSQPNSVRLPELMYIKANTLKKNGQINDAYNLYAQIINYYDGNIFASKAKIELGVIELNNKNYENAGLLFKEAGENRLDDIGAQAQYMYGLTLFKSGDYKEAITALVRVRSVFGAYDEWFTKSLLLLGDCYVKLNDKKQARDMYKAVMIKHNSGPFYKEANQKVKAL